ncbi:hypothetical protein [uncultured Campylobacter sp.]|uniref:hypothetical protein n=1 Tax=uncultured Campylobacter sp. TaxID=218934 RepID=UPI00262605B6|nr:hypothetical protein [uncultured Campylobacter sp.]
MCEARNSAACVDEIYGAGREIYSVKYEIKFHSAAHGDKIYGVMTDNKILGTALAGVRNSGLKNARVNLRPRNTYEDLKFKGSANFEPAGDVNFKFKNGVSFGFLCSGNVRSLKSRSWANALSLSAAAEISALVKAGEILKYGVTAGISALALASKILIPSATGKILSLSAVPRTDSGLKGASGC